MNTEKLFKKFLNESDYDSLIDICKTVKNNFEKQEMLYFIKDKNSIIYNQIRVNFFSENHSNIVRGESGNLIMETGVFKKQSISILKILKKKLNYNLDYKNSVWFYVPAHNVVPIHKDQNYGVDRANNYLTFSLSSPGSKIIIDGVVQDFTFVTFSPYTQAHGAIAGSEDLWVIQIPIK